MTIAAPWSSGRASSGAAVLSTISGMPYSRPDVGDFLDREDGQFRVGQRLGVIGAGLIVGRAAKCLGIGRIDEAHLDPLVLQRVGEQIPGAAIQVGRTDHVVARLGDVLDRQRRRRLARSHGQRRDPALERGNALFQHVGGRIHQAGIDVAQFLQRKQVRRVLGAVELIGRGLMNRHGDRSGGRIGAESRMQGQGFGMGALGRHGRVSCAPRDQRRLGAEFRFPSRRPRRCGY